MHFLRLTLTQNGTLRSANFYLRRVEQGNFRAIRTLGKATVTANTASEQRGDRWFLATELTNASPAPSPNLGPIPVESRALASLSLSFPKGICGCIRSKSS